MKFTLEQKQEIVKLKHSGLTSRQVATNLNCSKSAVNYVYNAWLDAPYPLYKPEDVAVRYVKETTYGVTPSADNSVKLRPKKPKILILDVETTADIVATFGRFKVNVGEQNIIQQGNQIATAAWKFLGDSEVQTAYSKFTGFEIDLDTEYELLFELYEAMKEAEAVVIHNARFDLGTIQHRMLAHGMGRLPTVKVIDTLMIARKYLKLRSNKLDSITKYFGLSNKIENSGISLWIKVQQGDKQALAEMLKYNIGDVEALEDVYNKFLPLNQGTSLSVFTDLETKRCTSCGSHNVNPTGRKVTTSLSAFDEYECTDCGAKMRNRVNSLTKEQRSNILMPV